MLVIIFCKDLIIWNKKVGRVNNFCFGKGVIKSYDLRVRWIAVLDGRDKFRVDVDGIEVVDNFMIGIFGIYWEINRIFSVEAYGSVVIKLRLSRRWGNIENRIIIF